MKLTSWPMSFWSWGLILSVSKSKFAVTSSCMLAATISCCWVNISSALVALLGEGATRAWGRNGVLPPADPPPRSTMLLTLVAWEKRWKTSSLSKSKLKYFCYNALQKWLMTYLVTLTLNWWYLLKKGLLWSWLLNQGDNSFTTHCLNSYSTSCDNWCTVGGNGRCKVGEVRAGTTSPMPDHKGFKLQ